MKEALRLPVRLPLGLRVPEPLLQALPEKEALSVGDLDWEPELVRLTEVVMEGVKLPVSEALLLRVPELLKLPLPVGDLLRVPLAVKEALSEGAPLWLRLGLWDCEVVRLALLQAETELLPEALPGALGATAVALALREPDTVKLPLPEGDRVCVPLPVQEALSEAEPLRSHCCTETERL